MKLFLSILIVSTYMYAAVLGTVGSIKGNVKVKSENSIKKNKLLPKSMINSGDMIITYSNASVIIDLKDGSQIILDAKSTLHFKTPKNIEQVEGKIYYKITSRDVKNKLKIKTPFAIIGIKGTTFVVTATDTSSVALKDGLIGVTSLAEEFELYREKTLSEYKQYIQKSTDAFEKYKDDRYEAPIRTKEFDLKAGKTVSFNKSKVNENSWTQEDDAEFSHFEALIGRSSTINIKKSISPSANIAKDEFWKDENDAELDAIEDSIDKNR